ncbi:MAG: PAS-domain containing protein [Alphaproteobacteria bacterium]|nr:PAS-domain containing protein [Alphaproteobacteria bacterium]
MSKANQNNKSTKTPRISERVAEALYPGYREKKRMTRQNARLESFLRAIPIEFCGWDQDETQAISTGFRALLGVEKTATLDDILSAFNTDDSTAIKKAFAALTEDNTSFDLTVFAIATKKTLRLSGRRGQITDKGQDFSVLWATDLTDMAAAAAEGHAALSGIKEKESEVRAALNAMPFPVWLRGTTLDIAWCNDAYAHTLDDNNTHIVADQKELPMTGSSKNNVDQRALAEKALADNKAQSARGHMIIDGQRRLIEMLEIPVAPEKTVVGVARDVTKEEELQAAYDHLAASQREALEQLRTAIAMFDQNTRLEFYNSAYEQLSGLSGTWLDTQPKITDIIDRMREARKLPEQADYKQFKQAWLGRFTSLIDPHEEMQYLPDGTALRTIAVPRPAGGLMLTQEDVTSRLQLETSYNTLMAVQQETIDNLAEGIAVFGEDGRLRLCNHAFSTLWDVPVSLLSDAPHISQILEKAQAFFNADKWDQARQIILSNALEREPKKDRLQRKDGSILEYSVIPLPDGNILNAWFDITDTVNVEQALVEKNAALQEAEQLKSDFLANVSYQLRTPLNAMMGFAEMLDQQLFGELNTRQKEYTGGMIEAGQRLVSLINDILDLSTIEAGYLKLYPAQIAIRPLVEQVMALTADWANAQKLAISIDDVDTKATIWADERRIKQVLLNLISNAINYSPNGGDIRISAIVEDENLCLTVKDSGLGIPADDLARVFTPFEKIHDKTTRRRSGAGLGLALVRSIIQLHNGTVYIDSIEGKGTTVTILLPVSQPDTNAF